MMPYPSSSVVFACGLCAMLLAFVLIVWDQPHWRRVALVGLLVCVLTTPVLAVVIVDQCSEEWLRRMYGDWWEWFWWLKGCYLMP